MSYGNGKSRPPRNCTLTTGFEAPHASVTSAAREDGQVPSAECEVAGYGVLDRSESRCTASRFPIRPRSPRLPLGTWHSTLGHCQIGRTPRCCPGRLLIPSQAGSLAPSGANETHGPCGLCSRDPPLDRRALFVAELTDQNGGSGRYRADAGRACGSCSTDSTGSLPVYASMMAEG